MLNELLTPARSFGGIPRMNSGNKRVTIGRRASHLLEAIHRGLNVPPEAWPARSKKGRTRNSPQAGGARLDALRAHRDHVAAELGLDPALLGPRAVLEQIAARVEKGDDPLMKV